MAKFSVNWIMTGTSEIEADHPTKIEDWLNDELAGHGKLAIQGETHEVRVGGHLPDRAAEGPAVSEYHIRVQLVNGDLEQLHTGMEELCEFTVAVEADSEEQALEKADRAIFDWAHKHSFYQSQWLCNHADRFTGAVPFTLENFFNETGGNLHEKSRNARIEAHGTANFLNWQTGRPWELEPHADDTPEEAAKSWGTPVSGTDDDEFFERVGTARQPGRPAGATRCPKCQLWRWSEPAPYYTVLCLTCEFLVRLDDLDGLPEI